MPTRGTTEPAFAADGPAVLPVWPARTIAVLVTLGPGPHAIPVSAPVRAGDDEILLSLHHTRRSLRRLRDRPEVALAIFATGNIAFTARGQATIIEEAMEVSPDYAAVAIAVEEIEDHRLPAFRIEAGVDRRWLDESEREALGARVAALRELSGRRSGER